ncbi:MAG: hypothetical protein ACREOI_03135 [bacterium]
MFESDQEIANGVLRRDPEAWTKFVDRCGAQIYDWAGKWIRQDLRFSHWKKPQRGEREYDGAVHDAFLWIFEQFLVRDKNEDEATISKLAAYEEEKDGSLQDYLNKLLHYNGNMRTDFFRWRFAHRTYLPAVMQKCSKEERAVFVLLRAQIPPQQIAENLNLSSETIQAIKNKLSARLFHDAKLPKKIPNGAKAEQKAYSLLTKRNSENEVAADLKLSLAEVAKIKTALVAKLVQTGSLPRAIRKCAPETQKAFVLWKLHQPEERIAEALGLSREELQEAKDDIAMQLFAVGGKDDLLARPQETELSDLLVETLPQTSTLDEDEQALLNQAVARFAKSLEELSREQLLLLQLFYNEELSAQEILEDYKRIEMNLPEVELKPKPKSIAQTTSRDVYATITNIKARLLELFKQACQDLPGTNVTKDTIETYLDQLGV